MKQNSLLCEKLFVSFVRSYFSIPSVTTNEGEFDDTKFLLNYSSSGKSILNLYCLAVLTQFYVLDDHFGQDLSNNYLSNDDAADERLMNSFTDEEIDTIESAFSKANRKTTLLAIKTLGTFLRKVVILLQTINRIPYFQVIQKKKENCTQEELSGLVSREFTNQSILQMLNYCGLKYDSILGLFDCGGSSSLIKFLKQWSLDFQQDLIPSEDKPMPINFDKETITYDLNFKTKVFIDLPENYSLLSRLSANYSCENFEKQLKSSTTGGGNSASNRSLAVQVKNNTSRMVVMCLLTGEILCLNGACCQEECEVRVRDDHRNRDRDRRNRDDSESNSKKPKTKKIMCGAGFRHAKKHNNFMIVLSFMKNVIYACRIKDNIDYSNDNAFYSVRNRDIVLTKIPTPYIDKYGEFDPGLSRGSPLFFAPEYYKYLQSLFLTGELLETFEGQRYGRDRDPYITYNM